MLTQLPPRARAKIAFIQDQLDTAELVISNAVSRVKSLRGSLMEIPAKPDNPNDDRADALRELESRKAAHQGHAAVVGGTLGRVRGFLATLPPGSALVDIDLPRVRPKRGETPADAVERVRVEIDAVMAERRRVEAAPLPRAEKAELLRKQVYEIGRRAKPEMVFPRAGGAVIRWGDSNSYGPPSVDRVFAMLCYLDSTNVAEILIGELDDEQKGAMPAAAREKRLAEIDERLERLGLEEQSLLDSADGVVEQRHDVDPRLVLGVRVGRVERRPKVVSDQDLAAANAFAAAQSRSAA